MRLNQQKIGDLPSVIKKPNYAKEELQEGILHLGIGAFHRAHQAYYTENVVSQKKEGWNQWGIVGVSLRSPTVRDQLEPQDNYYTLVEKGESGESYAISGIIKKVLVAPENPQAVIEYLENPKIKIVTLTVTEKGYCHDPATGNLNESHPQIIADLKNLEQPQSSIGFIVAGLAKRKACGVKSFTVLSCDNLPQSGDLLKKVVLQFAEKYDPELATWIEQHTAFPNAMIDRIVPATTQEDKKSLEEKMGYRDEAMVSAEPFTQWVVENKFCDARPQWETAGVLMVDDVDPYKEMKLRLLNGSHSLLAYCGFLAGYETISDTMSNPALERLCEVFMDKDAGQTITAPEGFDLNAYKRELIQRFKNPGLKHRTAQVAMDGSQKIPQRILPPLREQLASTNNVDIHCLAIAAWIRYTKGISMTGEAYEVLDPMAETLQSLTREFSEDAQALVKAFFSQESVFGADLLQNANIIGKVEAWIKAMDQNGVVESINVFLSDLENSESK